MDIPSKNAMSAITDCFCRLYHSGGCEDCPLMSISTDFDMAICTDCCSQYDEKRVKLLKACIKHGNAQMFKDLPSEYGRFVIRKALVV